MILDLAKDRTAQTLADICDEQRVISDLALGILEAQSRAIAPAFITGDPAPMLKEEIQLTLQRTADLLMDLRSLEHC